MTINGAMLIKEYRIALPLTVEEYRIAQLYMIAKKSREETRGAGSGVEILVNEPYVDGPGGNGQYTHKIYHVGSHLPGWFKALLPKSALTVQEEAWNAYPYTKTRYTCPFVEKFFLEIETKYFNDDGHQENVFDLTGSELRSRIVDVIEVVKDQLYGADYVKGEDPRYYVSQKSNRGPLNEHWIEEYWSECKGKETPLHNGKAIMCAYKLCRVEFRYWGMQSKIEKFIHDVALRKTMLRAHRQAWAWQDEWCGLTMEDIRQLEKETQDLLARKMASSGFSDTSGDTIHASDSESIDNQSFENANNNNKPIDNTKFHPAKDENVHAEPVNKEEGITRTPASSPRNSPKPMKPRELHFNSEPRLLQDGEGRRKAWSRSNSRGTLHSPGAGSNKSFDLQIANWRMESIVRDSDSSSDEEFFDCQENVDGHTKLTKWSSVELIPDEDDSLSPGSAANMDDNIFHQTFVGNLTPDRTRTLQGMTACSIDQSLPCSPTISPAHHPCPVSVLILVLHAGSVLDMGNDIITKKSDVTTFRSAFESVMQQHYPSMVGHLAIRLVSCPITCAEALSYLSSLNPYSFDASPSPSAIDGSTSISQDSIPIGAIPLFATSTPEYQETVSKVITTTNLAFQEFLRSEEGQGFNGQICLIGDSVGSLLAYDALCRSSQISSCFGSENSIAESDFLPSPIVIPRTNPLISISDGSGGEDMAEDSDIVRKRYHKSLSHPGDFSDIHETLLQSRHLHAAPPPRRRSSCSSEQSHHTKFDFEIQDFFMFGAPLGLLLAFRKVLSCEDKASPVRPTCNQVYNLFHPTDPLACRIEPLICSRFSTIQPVNVARYAKYPLGDGQPYHLLECIQSNCHLFGESSLPGMAGMICNRRMSEASIQSTMSGIIESVPLQTITALTQKWWGTKRVDFALYCPEGLSNFPTNALPHLFHASYWESSDVIAFILRQVVRSDILVAHGNEEKEMVSFSPAQPREKWVKKRTSVKIKNVNSNHRANDVIVKEGVPQILSARFMYGPLDMVALTGEKVDFHIMTDPSGEWGHLTTEVTDKTGRITYTIPKDKTLGFGMYPVKAVVRGDHTSIDFYLAVVPPKTETVVFSIDGSFTASMSVTGRDPKVRAGAVDVVRHWQELGYLIVYVTGRPDMQQQKVVAWLAQHNFPHGLVSFVDGLSTDPLRHKGEYLRGLIQDADIVVHAAYGSSKDISVYSSIGLKPDQIFIVGKVSKKQHSQAQILSDGYAAHLSDLTAHGGSRPAQGNARMVIQKGCFGLPGLSMSLRRRRSAKRTTSYPITGQNHGEGMQWSRGFSPRPPLGSVV